MVYSLHCESAQRFQDEALVKGKKSNGIEVEGHPWSRLLVWSLVVKKGATFWRRQLL